MLTFLHLSDIHLSVFDGDPRHDLEEAVRDRMLEDIDLMHSQVGEMDGVLLVGDVANRGQPGEYRVAADFLDRTCELIGCPKNRVICVPGNHDVDRDQHDAVHSAVREQLRRLAPEELSDALRSLLVERRGAEVLLAPFSSYNQFALQYGCAIAEEQLTWAPKSFSLGARELIVYGVTSSWISDAADSDKRDEHKMVLGAFQCGQVAEDREQVSIAMVHHPPGWLRDAAAVEPWMNRAHIILTGHEHDAGITLNAAQRRVAIASGAVNPARTMSGWIPAYNVLQLQLAGLQDKELELRVHVRCWRGDVAEFGPDRRFPDPYPLTIHVTSESDSEGEPAEEPPQAAPALPPEPINSDTHARVFRIMRAAPDARHRAARELGLIGESDAGGLVLDRQILDAALKQDKLRELEERIAND